MGDSHGPAAPSGLRGIVTALGLVALMGAAYYGARHWQGASGDYRRLAPGPDCDLRAGACSRPVGGGTVGLSISPQSIPLMQTLELRVAVTGLPADAVVVDIRGLNMNMGLNRTRMTRGPAGEWRGETILPVCSQRRMDWEAAVRIDGPQRVEVPFVFSTRRP